MQLLQQQNSESPFPKAVERRRTMALVNAISKAQLTNITQISESEGFRRPVAASAMAAAIAAPYQQPSPQLAY